jgi:hypothetical protein
MSATASARIARWRRATAIWCSVRFGERFPPRYEKLRTDRLPHWNLHQNDSLDVNLPAECRVRCKCVALHWAGNQPSLMQFVDVTREEMDLLPLVGVDAGAELLWRPGNRVEGSLNHRKVGNAAIWPPEKPVAEFGHKQRCNAPLNEWMPHSEASRRSLGADALDEQVIPC